MVGKFTVVYGLLLSALSWAGVAAAATPGPGDVVHRVTARDTLEGVARSYTGVASNWKQLQRVNQVEDPRQLQPGSTLVIPARLLRIRSATAKVVHVKGDVRAKLPGSADTVEVGTDDVLPEGTELTVGRGGYAFVTLSDGSGVSVLANSRMKLASLKTQPSAGIQQDLLQLESGRAEVQAVPRRNPASRLEIRTPFAVASVRGTRFGVDVDPAASMTTDVTEGVVAINSPKPGAGSGNDALRLTPGQGVQVPTSGVIPAARTLPAAPDLSGVRDTITDPQVVAFDLPAVDGVVGYRVRLSALDNPDQVFENSYVAGREVRLTGLPDADYQLGVKAVDSVGLTGFEAVKTVRIDAYPLAPLFQFPGPDQRVNGEQLRFRCSHPAGMTVARLQVARDASFDNPVVNMPALAACDHVARLEPGTYYWRVGTNVQRADGSEEVGPMGPAQRFEVVGADGGAPQDLAPGVLQAHWQSLAGMRYHVQVSQTEDFARRLFEGVVATGMLRLSPMATGQYYLRVRTLDARGVAGQYGPTQTVRVLDAQNTP